MGTPHVLALTGAALNGEWWRLWTGHLVHYSAPHLLLNVVALLPPLVVTRAWNAIALWAAIAAPALSVALLQCSTFAEYRGASGLIAGVWVFVAIELFRRKRSAVALVISGAIAVKLIAEATGTLPWSGEVEPLHAAHCFGALLGAIGGAVNASRSLYARSHPPASA